MTTTPTHDNPAIRVWSIGYLAEMMGQETTTEEAEAMRDLLVEAKFLDWASDGNGGLLYPIADTDWDHLLAEAVAV